MIDDEVKRATKLLETLMKMAGVNRQDLDARMGAGRGYASQVLSGRMELKYRHVLAVLEGLGIAPATFFGLLYPPGETAREAAPATDLGAPVPPVPMDRLLGHLRPAGAAGSAPEGPPEAAPAALDSDELDRRIRAVVREMLGGPPAPGDPHTSTT